MSRACAMCHGTDEAALCAAGQCRWEWEHQHELRSNPATVLGKLLQPIAEALGTEVDQDAIAQAEAYCRESGGTERGPVWPSLAHRQANPLPVKEEP
jgi:hypothetical protein